MSSCAPSSGIDMSRWENRFPDPDDAREDQGHRARDDSTRRARVTAMEPPQAFHSPLPCFDRLPPLSLALVFAKYPASFPQKTLADVQGTTFYLSGEAAVQREAT